MSESGKLIQGQPGFASNLNVKILGEFTKELCLLDAVDSQVGLQVRVHLDHLGGIARLFDDKVDEKALEFLSTQGRRCSTRWSRGRSGWRKFWNRRWCGHGFHDDGRDVGTGCAAAVTTAVGGFLSHLVSSTNGRVKVHNLGIATE